MNLSLGLKMFQNTIDRGCMEMGTKNGDRDTSEQVGVNRKGVKEVLCVHRRRRKVQKVRRGGSYPARTIGGSVFRQCRR